MLSDEFSHLMVLFQNVAEGKTLNLEEVFKESLVFFENLKEQIATGTPEDRQAAAKMMSELYSEMMIVSKRICERSGMTEEQLMAFAENPANFSQQQWKSVQESKERMIKAGKDLVQTVENSLSPEEKRPGASGQDPKRPRESKGKKSKWMRS